MKKNRTIFNIINTLIITVCPPSFAGENGSTVTSNKVAPIVWQPCYTNDNPALLCASYAVPLDYQARKNTVESTKTIDIALIKLPAANTSKKSLGSLFINPGGPGGSGVDWLRTAGRYSFSEEVRNSYDLISFDPRGIHLSTPATCGMQIENVAQYYTGVYFPSNPTQASDQIEKNKNFSALCKENGNAILQHMSTADVAKDMDIMRQAVGDPLLNYVGYSYGSYLGATYANLFPERVGRFILDGVLDPIEWSTGRGFSGWLIPVTKRLGGDKASLATLNEFLRLCDLAGADNCHFAGNAAQRFDALANTIKTHPITLFAEDGTAFNVDTPLFITTVKGLLYNVLNWQGLADLLAFTEAGVPPRIMGERYSKLMSLFSEDQALVIPFENGDVGFSSVLCSDSNNPRAPWIWPLAAAVADEQNGYFGASWSWVSSICAHWPANQLSRYSGPFNKRTRNTVLVTNTLFDPATSYAGAQTVRQLLPNSRLLTVAGWGHTTPGLSTCADSITATYLLTGELPNEDTTCTQDTMPFIFTDEVDVFAGMPKTQHIPTIMRPRHLKSQLTEREIKNREIVMQAILRQVLPHTNKKSL
ncbi:MAG TPA: alpha/beta hydrolase [Cellvibrionaceae bacterium]